MKGHRITDLALNTFSLEVQLVYRPYLLFLILRVDITFTYLMFSLYTKFRLNMGVSLLFLKQTHLNPLRAQ